MKYFANSFKYLPYNLQHLRLDMSNNYLDNTDRFKSFGLLTKYLPNNLQKFEL